MKYFDEVLETTADSKCKDKKPLKRLGNSYA